MQRDIRSEITGSVWKISKVAGDDVESGDVLLIFESMKMEIPLITEDSGTVVEICVAEGDAVKEGDVVAVLSI